MEQRVHLDAEKKLNVYTNYERQEKHANGVFHIRKLNIPISHNGEMIVFLKFQGTTVSKKLTILSTYLLGGIRLYICAIRNLKGYCSSN